RIEGWAHVLDGVEVRIVDPESGAVQPPGKSGEIQVRGWSVMQGYYKMPEQTAKTIDADGWLHTGDLAERAADGYVTLRGRRTDLIISGGFNIYPREIEELLLEQPGVREALVLTVDSPVWGMRERDRRNRFTLPEGLTLANVAAPLDDAAAGLAGRGADRLAQLGQADAVATQPRRIGDHLVLADVAADAR
ncbi:MAG: AMP-binding protein, partial [Gemmatimonadota bacterium]